MRDRKSMSGRYVALNRGFPAYRESLALLRALERRCPQTRVGKPPGARNAWRQNLAPTWNAGPFAATDFDLLFYSKVRTRTLLSISAAGSAGATDVTDLGGTFMEDRRSVWNAVNHWQREGGRVRSASSAAKGAEIIPDWHTATEMRALLRALRRATGEYDRLAQLNFRNPRSPRFIAQR